MQIEHVKEMQLVIPIPPRTKKNHQQIVRRNGKSLLIPSKQYREYAAKAGAYIDDTDRIRAMSMEYPVNVKCTFYMDTLRKVDLVNLEQAILDILVKYGILEDDNYTVVAGMDGSRVRHDKEHPRTEIVISEIQNPKKGQGHH